MRYLVMECHPGYAILLDEEGRFLKAANFCYEVGQTVYEPVLMKEPSSPSGQRRLLRWASSGMAAVAACFLLFFGLRYYQNYVQPYSSIYLSINPEVQMDLNRQGTVVKLTGTNEDGVKLLKGYDGKGKDKVTAADELIDRAIDMGFLSEGGQISFSIDSPDEALFQEYGVELRTKVTEHLDGRITVTIEVVNHRTGQGEAGQEGTGTTPEQTPPSDPPASDTPASDSPASDSPTLDTPAPADTDYGPNNDGVTDYTQPADPPTPADTDYGPGNDGVTDYNDTDYGPNNDGVTDYSDTDYGPNNDGVTDYTQPADPPAPDTPTSQPADPPAPADTDYGTGSNGITDYTDGTTDYDPGNVEGDSGYDSDDANDDGDDDGEDDEEDDD